MSAFFITMPPRALTLLVENDGFVKLADKIRYTARNIDRDFKLRRRPVDAKALTFLRFTPASPKYPIIWQTPRQRRAFWATNGFGKGIPSQRSGKLAQAWLVRQQTTASGGSISFDNGEKHAVYVQGDIQQRMHIASGYHNVNDGVEQYTPEYAAVLVQSFYAVGE